MEIDLIEIDKVMRVIQYQERVSVLINSEDLSWRSNEGKVIFPSSEMMYDDHYIQTDSIASL